MKALCKIRSDLFLIESLVAASAKSEAVTATEIDAGVGPNDNSFEGVSL
jgi:hypothetical protein